MSLQLSSPQLPSGPAAAAASRESPRPEATVASRGGFFARLLSWLMFIDLPIKRKFTLFALGTGFWFVAMAVVGVAAMTAIHYNYHQVSENSVPYRQATATILGQLNALEQDLEAVLHGEYRAVDKGTDLAREHARGIREVVAALGLRQSEGQRAGTIVEQILQTMAKSNPAGLLYLQEMLELSNRLDRNLDEFFLAKQEFLAQGGGDSAGLVAAHAVVGDRIQEGVALTNAYEARVEAEYRTIDERIYQIIRNAVHAILLVLVLALTLTLLFIRNIIQAFYQPIASIINQIEALGTGDIDQAKKVVIRSRDEIGALSQKFNLLIDAVHGMTIYKKVIEEDSTLDEVYRRLGEVFRQDLGLSEYTIYEVNMGKKEMMVGHPPRLGDDQALHCHEDILGDCTLCRAVKTGRNISSFEYRGICRQFKGEADTAHVCIPLLLSGNTGGVVQFVVSAGGDKPVLDSETSRRLFKAENYINQSLSVIEAKRLMNTLRDSAMVDPLTGLYNRRFLQDHSKQLISGVLRRQKQIGLLVCDLDYFKQVNDTHGHDVGDQILRELSVVLQNSVRDADVVIRFGGEEFLILLLDVELGEAVQVAEKIRLRVEQLKVKAGDVVLQKTISLGVSEFPHDTEGFWQAIKYADVALYQAKDQGRNRSVRFTPEMWTQNDF